MKRARLVVLCLAFLLISATSSFAAVIWTAPADANIYHNIGTILPNVWEQTTPDLSAVQGNFAPELEMKIKLNGVWNEGVNGFGVPTIQVFTAGSTNPVGKLQAWYPLMNAEGEHNEFTLHSTLALEKDGIYNLKAFAVGYSCDATWELLSATLTPGANPCVIPIPAAFMLLGSGLLGLFGVNKVRNMGENA